MAHGLSTPDPSLNPTHLSIRRGCATTTHYTHHQVNLMVSRNTTLVPSLGLHFGPACEAGLSSGMRRELVSPQIRKKEQGHWQGVWGMEVPQWGPGTAPVGVWGLRPEEYYVMRLKGHLSLVHNFGDAGLSKVQCCWFALFVDRSRSTLSPKLNSVDFVDSE